jgi:UDP-N-acetylmuramate dehydrogenase
MLSSQSTSNLYMEKLTSIGIEPQDIKFVNISNNIQIERLAQEKTPLVVIGGGTNTLIASLADSEIIGRITIGGIRIKWESWSDVIIEVGAGIYLNDLIIWSLSHGLWGLEVFSGIPGTVGGAIVQNTGAYGVEMSILVDRLLCWDSQEHLWIEVSGSWCQFGQRDSIFRSSSSRFLITQIFLRLSRHPDSNKWGRLLEIFPKEYSAEKIRDFIINHRKDRFPDPRIIWNSGSVLIHPLVEETSKSLYLARQLGITAPLVNQKRKIPLGAVLEKGGVKGKITANGICVSKKHANFLENSGDGKLEDWYLSVEIMRKVVKDLIDLDVAIEPVILGHWKLNNQPKEGILVVIPPKTL